MKKLLLPLALLCGLSHAQTPVTPIVQPHETFVDASGLPCSLCKLSSFSAGTTTPLATFTDSTGLTQNTNPIVLDIAGGANIWLNQTATYKFVLKTNAGATIWTVDNVKAVNGGLPCSTVDAIQYSTGTALACDASIKINPSSHAIQVGGAISGPAFTLRNLSTIPNSWTMDVTTPATALASLGDIPLTGLAVQAADTAIMNATGGSTKPTAVALPTGCGVTGISYDTATHTWACSTAATAAADTVQMNATGGIAAPTAVAMPTGCTGGVNYDTTTHAWACVSVAPITGTLMVASQSPISSNSCVSFNVTMSSSVPSNAVVVISVAQGDTVSGNSMIDPHVNAISGSTVTVAFCNNWNAMEGWNAATYNLLAVTQ